MGKEVKLYGGIYSLNVILKRASSLVTKVGTRGLSITSMVNGASQTNLSSKFHSKSIVQQTWIYFTMIVIKINFGILKKTYRELMMV